MAENGAVPGAIRKIGAGGRARVAQTHVEIAAPAEISFGNLINTAARATDRPSQTEKLMAAANLPLPPALAPEPALDVDRLAGNDKVRWHGVAAAMFAVAWGGNQFTPLLSMYEQRSAFDHVTVTLLLFAYVIGLVPALLSASALTARVGPRRLLIASLTASAAGSALIAIGEHSPAVIFAGRTIIGLALGIGMVVGGSTLTRLARRDPDARPGTGSRRAAMSLTAGFGIGAAVAGLTAQWAPFPTQTPFIIHIVVCAVALVLIVRAGDLGQNRSPTNTEPFGRISRAFILLVIPAAPLIFGALGIAYAVLPSFIAGDLGQFRTGFAAFLCLFSLGLGFFTQQLVGTRIPENRRWIARPLGVTLIVIGILMAIYLFHSPSVILTVTTVAILGVGYGLLMIGCLLTVERFATPRQLPLLTGITYTLAYLGFGIPTVLAWLDADLGIGYPTSLLCLAVIASLAVGIGSLIYRVQRSSDRRRTN